ncbi:RNA polymerase sigma factor [Acetobacter syzygii]|uniref:RNA polymerase subunit sigma-70 n=1 Tax=Acetobacter syzygii TaxID=146476 RepID=A0A270B820_9PROT|nr:RNA polymerase sigma factor [Acetobacter syzygii]PAL20950.1 hypothetical protein B9K05_12185 [Acetobacter syzygii]PAL23005.1 hypothetical protein B9K04_12150 [Acetobacter syzygii]
MQDNIATLTNLMVKERPSLFHLMYRIIKNREAAEDAVQALFEKIQHVEPEAVILSPHAYLYRLASNLAIDSARSRCRREDVQDSIHDLLWLEDDKPTAEQQLAGKKRLAQVEAMIETMPEPMKTIFCLNRFHGLSQTEIARRSGKSVSLINRYVQRALNMLATARDD